MEFSWSDEDERFRQELREFIANELPERWIDLIPGEEPASEFIREFCGKLGQRGWLTPHWPREYGGADGSAWQFIILGEELWSAGEPRGSQYMNVNWIGPAIINAGSPEQKSYHLRRISAGDVFWCQGFSEVGAGTDLASMQTTAERDGDYYVINGEKVWTSYAAEAEFCFLLARSDPESTGNKGISVFLVPTDSPGLTIEPIPSVLDIHEFNRLTFENVRVPAAARLGPENGGWRVVREALSHERIGGPRYARAALVTQRLREIARSRGWWERDGIKSRLAEAEASCEAARLLVYQAVGGLGSEPGAGGHRALRADCRRTGPGDVRKREPRPRVDRQRPAQDVDDRWTGWRKRGSATQQHRSTSAGRWGKVTRWTSISAMPNRPDSTV
jgi:alkylation response protein AidB-like acyl-CoA dehydrogenase